jgi:ATP-dependent Clp protease ATP-binding subunit ClpC
MSDPKDIFKKFAKGAKQIFVTSQKIADNMNSGIGSEHLLISMATTLGNLAYDILKENAVSIDQIKLILSLNNIQTNINSGLSQELKEIIISSAQKATIMNNGVIEPEHLLWAILNDKNCRANTIINRIGINTNEMLEDLDEVLEEIKFSNDQYKNINQKQFDLLNMLENPFPQNFGPVDHQMMADQSQGVNPKSKTPMLDQFGTDLIKLAKDKKLDPLIGRSNEINRAIQILCRRNKNNPILVGEPGVGKTAIIEGLAQKINSGHIPEMLKDKKIINLDLAMVIAGTMYRGQFEDRVKKILNELIKNKNIIIFIDELHTIVGAGSAEGSMDVANILKPALAKGQIRLIGATTTEEYRKFIEKDSALERRMQVIKVNEPSTDDSIKILTGLKSRYEEFHNVNISNEAIESAVKFSKRYISDRFLPDKAIDLIDEALSAKKISNNLVNKENIALTNLQKTLKDTILKKDKAVENQDYKLAAEIKTHEIKLNNQIAQLNLINNPQNTTEINSEDIAKIVSNWTGIPFSNLIRTQSNRTLNIDKILKNHIIGQNEAIDHISKAIKRTISGINDPNRPIGTFLFLGPTGVGKTELAKVLANELFSDKKSLIKIDMSEFSEKHNVARLVGAPPGYVGYEGAGKLTEAVRKNPYSLILLDEIEKAHPEVFNILLQIMEDGYLTDAKGKQVNFKNTIIILTSNIGMQELTKQAIIGFKLTDPKSKNDFINKYNQIKDSVLAKLKDHFKPELLNRFDNIIVFKPLDMESIEKIVEIQLNNLVKRLNSQGINVNFSSKVIKHITKMGYNIEYGARPIKRKISELIENPIADIILKNDLIPTINIDVVKEQIIFK